MPRGDAFGKCFLERINGVALRKRPEWWGVGMTALAGSIHGMAARAVEFHQRLSLGNVVCPGLRRDKADKNCHSDYFDQPFGH